MVSRTNRNTNARRRVRSSPPLPPSRSQETQQHTPPQASDNDTSNATRRSVVVAESSSLRSGGEKRGNNIGELRRAIQAWPLDGPEWTAAGSLIAAGISDDQAPLHVAEHGADRCRANLAAWKKLGSKVGPGKLVSMIREDAAGIAAAASASKRAKSASQTRRADERVNRDAVSASEIVTGQDIAASQARAAAIVAGMTDAALESLATKIIDSQPARFKQKFLEAQRHALRTSPRWAVAFSEWFEAHPPKNTHTTN